MLPTEIQKIKEDIKVLLSKQELDKELSQRIHNEILDYCRKNYADQSNFKEQSEFKSAYYESARGTMQIVYNMVADDNFMFHQYKTIEDDRFNRFGYKMALKELENAEVKGLVSPEDDPWQKFIQELDKMPKWFKELSQSKEIVEATDEFVMMMNELHLEQTIKPKSL